MPARDIANQHEQKCKTSEFVCELKATKLHTRDAGGKPISENKTKTREPIQEKKSNVAHNTRKTFYMSSKY